MKRAFTKAAALAAALTMIFSAASCSEKKQSDKSNNLAGGSPPANASMELEDMPYGAEYFQKLSSESDVPLSIEYDPRFVTDAEADALSNYFYALSERNPEYLKKAVHPDLLKYRLANSSYENEQEFLDAEYELIKQYTGSDFTFDYILVDGRLKDDTDSAFETYDKLMEAASPGCNITSRNVYMVNCTYAKPDDGGSYSLQMRLGDYMYICVYTIDGETYVVS